MKQSKSSNLKSGTEEERKTNPTEAFQRMYKISTAHLGSLIEKELS